MNELNKLYHAMLCTWGAVIKEDGRILLEVDNGDGSTKEYPITVDGMNVYLPTSEVLEGIMVDKVAFHPACENIMSKETEIFKIIRKLTALKLLNAFRNIPVVLFSVAGKNKSSWTQKTLDMLEPLKGVKAAVREELKQLFGRLHVEVEENGLDNRFIHFKITKGSGTSKITGGRVYYKTKPTFPFYTEMVRRLARSDGQSDNQQVEVNNHSVSRGALKIAVHLFQSIIPAVQSPDDHEHEANEAVAARLVSYLRCYTDIAEQINKVQSTFRVEFDKAGIYPINLDWTETLEQLPDIYKQVPVMDYNSHNTHEETTSTAAGRQDMAGLMSVTSVQNANAVAGAGVHGGVYPNQQTNQIDNSAYTGFVTTPPPQVMGTDRLLRYEINAAQNRVLHHGINTQNNNPVVYICSRQGAFLERQETAMNAMLGGAYNMTGMAGMTGVGGGMTMPGGVTWLPNGMLQLPTGQVIHPSMLNQVQPTMPTVTPSVTVDHSAGFGGSPNWG